MRVKLEVQSKIICLISTTGLVTRFVQYSTLPSYYNVHLVGREFNKKPPYRITSSNLLSIGDDICSKTSHTGSLWYWRKWSTTPSVIFTPTNFPENLNSAINSAIFTIFLSVR